MSPQQRAYVLITGLNPKPRARWLKACGPMSGRAAGPSANMPSDRFWEPSGSVDRVPSANKPSDRFLTAAYNP